MAAKYRLSTLGCKVNQYESQLIRQTLESFGLRPAARHETPDIAVVNTCAVTAAAERDNRRAVRRAADGGRTPVVVVGCGASADPERLRNIPGVASLLGHNTNVVGELRKLLASRLQHLPAAADRETNDSDRTSAAAQLSAATDASVMSDAGRPFSGAPASQAHLHSNSIIPSPLGAVKQGACRDSPPVEGAPFPGAAHPDASPADLRELAEFANGAELLDQIRGFDGHQRAFLKVQDGCDAFCTYCIIPQLRPTLRSKPSDVVAAEARSLVRAGHKEIILTGIFLGAYGRDTAIRKRLHRQRSPLAELIDVVSRVEGLQRLRISSLEPGDVDDSILEVLASRSVCVPHLHLPLQAGSAEILRRMNRQYTRDDYLAMIDRVRAALDKPALSTDMIVGFPGETDSDFQASIDIATYAGFCKIHAFPFSPRAKTAAAKWRHLLVPPPVVRERMAYLAQVESQCSLNFRRSLIGIRERIIIEGADDVESPKQLLVAPRIVHGRSDRYFEVHVEADGSLRTGDIVPVRIDRVTPTRTHGTCLSPVIRSISLPLLAS